MSVDRQDSGLELAERVSEAFASGDRAAAAALAGEAAAAFLAEQGEPTFDAPNMLRLRADALLALGGHAAAATTLDRADALALPLPEGEPFDRLKVHLGRLRGLALLDAGDRPGARTALLRTLDRCEATLGSDDPDAAPLHNLLGIVGKFMGTFDDAAAHYAPALEIYRVAGRAPGVIATLHHNLDGLAHSRGDLITAERETRRALELHASSSGAGHPDTAADRGQLAAILSELGRHDEAERELRRTADDFAAALGPDHVEVAIARTALGAALHRVGRLDEADAAYRGASPCASARRARLTRCSRPRCSTSPRCAPRAVMGRARGPSRSAPTTCSATEPSPTTTRTSSRHGTIRRSAATGWLTKRARRAALGDDPDVGDGLRPRGAALAACGLRHPR